MFFLRQNAEILTPLDAYSISAFLQNGSMSSSLAHLLFACFALPIASTLFRNALILKDWRISG